MTNGAQDHRTREQREAALEAEADRLLVSSLETHGRGEYPFYSRSYLRRLATTDERALIDDEAHHPTQQVPAACVIWRIARKARLTSLETDLLRLAATGHKSAESARVLAITAVRARRVLRKAITKLQAHAHEIQLPTDDQVHSVLVEEQNRRARVCESHCKPGQELCRKTGLCQRRWYLRQG